MTVTLAFVGDLMFGPRTRASSLSPTGVIFSSMPGTGYPTKPDHAGVCPVHNANGAVLTTVAEGQPADKAGLQRGDVITEFNGKPVVDSDALVAMGWITAGGLALAVIPTLVMTRKYLRV